MKFIKEHKMLFIFLTFLLVFLIIIIFVLKQFMFDTSKSEYGNRLNDIDKVQISKQNIIKLENEISKIEKVKSTKYDSKGRLINVLIEVKKETSLDEGKEYGNKTLEYFDEEEKKYYDIQVFIKNEDSEIEGFPVIGYKHKTREAIVWD